MSDYTKQEKDDLKNKLKSKHKLTDAQVDYILFPKDKKAVISRVVEICQNLPKA